MSARGKELREARQRLGDARGGLAPYQTDRWESPGGRAHARIKA